MTSDSTSSRRRALLRRAADVLLRPAPVNGQRVRGLALASLLVLGGVIGLAALTFSGDRSLPAGAMSAIGVGAVLLGLALARWWERIPPWGFQPALALSTSAVCGAVYLAGAGTAGMAFANLLFFVAVYVGFCFSLAAAAAHGAYALALLGLVLHRLDQPYHLEVVLLAGVAGTIAGFSNGLAHVRSRSEVDPLTGVFNRRGLERVLRDEAERADADARPLAVALLDLDDFKRHNDLHGHEQGDRTLIACVRAWQALLPTSATIARLGGDEFVVVLPELKLSAARRLVDRLRRAVPLPVRCSAGVAAWRPGDTQSLILGRADTALYGAKESGRDQTHVVGDESARAAELWRALEEGELLLHFQPVVSLATGQTIGVEALIRWQHPVEGLLGPVQFLPVAERSGAIHALGRWVLDETCRQLHAWRTGVPAARHLVAAINVSTTQLQRAEFVGDVAAALARHRLRPGALTIEITEGAFEGEPQRLLDALEALRRLGVCLAMDDFGTGHSSLARLQTMPFDVLKIDRSFVAGLGTGDASGAVLAAIVALAESLGMRTVAEGIETAEQFEVVRHSGCTWAQGFGIGRPVAAACLTQRLLDTSSAGVAAVAASG
ncbi:putative bifunctional diguanylate cyclase/phosphodiesterase [Egicoccus sp. AB-alg6-2]|uniref:putative bifunctional diguanylate cyclase/phosphodiesterase n=1 Tax=Egicoccus sp. AB-alg6-2 TaxID=3242692 RepID=UPI00359CF6BF